MGLRRFTATAGPLILLLAVAAAAAASGWSRQHTPSPPAAQASYLNGVSCTTVCTAVGSSQPGATRTVTLVERRHSSKWSVQPSPNRSGRHRSELLGVSCPFPSACVAVGYYGDTRRTPLVERFNGKRWLVARKPSTRAGGGYLEAVSCTSARACTAVGAASRSGTAHARLLAERFNGKRWSVQRPPRPGNAKSGYLTGVWCTWPTICTAVGYYERAKGRVPPLAERWNGKRWLVQHVPLPGGASEGHLLGVSCPSNGSCTAVGYIRTGTGAYAALAERLSGQKWSLQRPSRPSGAQNSYLQGVSCTSRIACSAVGYYQNPAGATAALAERWNGKRWIVQATTKPGADSRLYGVSCPSSSECTAAGLYQKGTQRELTLAEHWSS